MNEGNLDRRRRRLSKRRAPNLAMKKPKWRVHKAMMKHLNFYSVLSLYYIVSALLGAVVISIIDNLSYMDGLFLAVSAITSTGLSTVSMAELSRGSFATLAVLIFGGGSLVVPLGAIVYRRMKYNHIRKSFPKGLNVGTHPVIAEFELQHRALGTYLRIAFVYILLWHIGGFLLISAALHQKPPEPELEQRGYSQFDNGAFLAVSSFNNAGFSLSSQSVAYLHDNPLCYLGKYFVGSVISNCCSLVISH